MRIFLFLFLWVLIFLCGSCHLHSNHAEKPVSKEEEIQNNIRALKEASKKGDLLVRLTDDLISERVKYLNEKDYSYSHAGLVIEKNNQKYVCDISPNDKGADTIELTPIDSFISVKKNIRCALYRYNFSKAENDSFSSVINKYLSQSIRFDRVYDLTTDDKLYCSEMIYKALKTATNNRIVCRQSHVPTRMQPIVASYLQKEKVTKKMVAEKTFITLDNLYSMPECSLIIKFELKSL